MDLSKALSLTAGTLIKIPVKTTQVFIHDIGSFSNDKLVVVANVSTLTETIKGTGVSQSITQGFIKAISEIGESIIKMQLGLKNRSGLAGGIFYKTAEERAKLELIEKDSFFYHYRNKIPFKQKVFDGNIGTAIQPLNACVFEMETVSNDIFSFCAIEKQASLGLAECIRIGFGTGFNRKEAIQKSGTELLNSHIDHLIRENWCAEIHKNPSNANHGADFHHSQSRDFRNLKRITDLCSNRPSHLRPKEAKQFSETWQTDTVDSPIRGMNFCFVKNSNLISLDFRNEEKLYPDEGNTPLYHPLW